MTRTIFVAAAVALAGCAFAQDVKGQSPSFDPRNPKVYVVRQNARDCKGKNAIVVDQEPVYFFLPGKAVTITWRLQTKGYSFVPRSNIPDPTPVGKSQPGEITKCQAKDQSMTCENKRQTAGHWKYTLQIQADEKGCRKPDDLDPLIGND